MNRVLAHITESVNRTRVIQTLYETSLEKNR